MDTLEIQWTDLALGYVLLLIPFARTVADRLDYPREFAWILLIGSLVSGLFVMWGLENRQPWAWFASLLAFAVLYFGATVFSLHTALYSTLLALLLSFSTLAACGLPAFCLVAARESFFPDEPQG